MGKRRRKRRVEVAVTAPIAVTAEPIRDNVVKLRPKVEASEPVEIWRSVDAEDINPILNHPDVFRYITVPGCDTIDATPIVADTERNFLLMTRGGGLMFCQIEPGVYEVHTNFLLTHRGRHALKAVLAALRWMFTRTDCMVVHTRVPAFNKAAGQLARLVGGTHEFDRLAAWPTPSGLVDVAFYSLRYDDWVRQTKSLCSAGHKFHERLELERQRHGATEPQHTDEECHDLYVGACAETIYGGQPEKAVILYNRWARLSGYGLISLVAKNPLVIDIGDALLQMTQPSDFKVIKFR